MTKKRCWFLALLVAAVAAAQMEASAQKEATIEGKAREEISAPVRNGAILAAVGWTVDADTGEDVLRGSIAYRPDPRPNGASCRKIRFVQVARVERSGEVDYDWKDGEVNRNPIRTTTDASRGVEKGYFVDHDAFKCSPGEQCSPYFRDYWPNPDESQDGFLNGRLSAKASLADYPFGWDDFESITLESCARCADDGQFLACVEWGGRWPGQGDRTLLPIRVEDRPSPTFMDALRRFNLFYSNSDGVASVHEAAPLSGGN